ncbi:MAG: spore cortex biosynthesis protein YabQ [Clostridia bacterium]|nr:spore cortex biosynthesis protein YabQ [Clostridia bacterium]
MTAGAFDLATAHAIMAEASAAGDVRAVPPALLFGVGLGLLYDITRWREMPDGERVPCRIRAAAMLLGDVFFMLACGVLGAVFLYRYNCGILRWYLVLGWIVGYAAYRSSAGRLVRRGLSALRAWMHAVIRLLHRYLLSPVLRIGAHLIDRYRRYLAARRTQRNERRAAGQADKGQPTKRTGVLWQRKKSSRRKKRASLPKSHFSSFSDSAPSQSSSCMARSAIIGKRSPRQKNRSPIIRHRSKR